MMDEYELEDTECPACGHSPIHASDCTVLGCEDGWVDRYDEDPLWYDQDKPERCDECYGTGILRWCPKCGFDLQKPRKGKANQ